MKYYDIPNVRRDGWGVTESLGDFALLRERLDAEDEDEELANKRFAAWRRKNG